MRRFSLLVFALVTACSGPSTLSGTTDMNGMMERHMAPLPPDYVGIRNPVTADAESLSRGQVLYAENCAACHGDNGWGDGPAAANLDPAPAPLAHTVSMLSEGYLFYRLSEGGNLPPFNSAMPAWKEKLTETERWDLINYLHSLGDDTMGDDMMEMMSWMMAPWWIIGWALIVGLIAVSVIGVVWAIRRPRSETPLTILQRRYVSGEITTEQFEMMKHNLNNEPEK